MARVLWVYWCDVRMRHTVLALSAFFRVLHSEVSKWLEMPSPSLSHDAVDLFLRRIQGWLSDRDIPVLPGSAVDGAKHPCDVAPSPAPYMFASRRDKAGHKREQAEQLGRDVEFVSVPDVYTDGSYADEAPREGFAGYGV